MGNTIKNILSFVFRVCLSAVLLGYIFSKIDISQTWKILQSADLGFILCAGVVYAGINVILLWRWFIFIKAMDLTVPVTEAVRYYLAGLFGNLFLPSSIGGDFLKIYGLCKNSSQKTRVVASVILDRLSGFAAIILVAVGAFVLGHSLLEDNMLLIPIAGIAVVSGGGVCVLFNERIYHFFCRIFNGLPKVKTALMDLHYDIALMKRRRPEAAMAIAVSCLSQVIYAVSWYLTAKALGQNAGIIYFFIFVPLTCIASSFPSIGGLGVREMGTVYLFGKIGMDAGVAASISLINFLFMVIIGLIGGLIYVFTLSSGRIQYRSPDAVVRRAKA